MKTRTTILSALLLLGSAAATAHPYYRPHRHYGHMVHYVPRPVVFEPAPVYVEPAPIVVQEPATVIVHEPAPVVVEEEVVEEAPQPRPRKETDYLGIGIRFTGAALSGQKLTTSSVENPAMGGLGLMFRAKLDENWGIELAGDYLQGRTEDFTQTTMPLTLSAIFYLFPETRINPYFLGGGGLYLTRLSYKDGAVTHELTEVGGHAGGGVQVKLAKRLALSSDLRVLGVYKNMGEQSYCTAPNGQKVMCDLGLAPSDDKMNLGVQFQAGLTYFF